MKLLAVIIAFAAVVLISTTSSEPSPRGLQDDFEEFVELLPFDKILDVAFKYVLTDTEVQEALQYLLGPEFSTIWDQVFALKEVRDVLDYLEQAGVEAYAFFNDLADLLGLNPVKPNVNVRHSVSTRGLSNLIDEVLALLPKDELLALFEHKLETSVEFKAFFDKLKSTDFQKLVEFAGVSV